MNSPAETLLPVRDYDLAATLDSGQVFRWQGEGDAWTGVLGRHSLRLTQKKDGIHAQAAAPVADWHFLREFLQSDIDLAAILKTFPEDEPMRAAVGSCQGLRLLRQDPWECLASFILSSTKQIVQIRQIVALLCERFGEPIGTMPTTPPAANGSVLIQHDGARGATRPTTAFAFPTPQKIAAASEAELRACKMGFRAPGLLGTARAIADGKLDLESLRKLTYSEARIELMKLRGVGGKIADCVLLFAYGFDSAFPVDVWIERALQELYFPRRRASDKRLRKFAATHFGPHAGYAQQYLFHYMRTKVK
ncbi:MAG: DNA glycosylase [Verrucomicrobiae bacterium]|nr:DNA glycosylase [Verrucomicrobiae bacterium]